MFPNHTEHAERLVQVASKSPINVIGMLDMFTCRCVFVLSHLKPNYLHVLLLLVAPWSF